MPACEDRFQQNISYCAAQVRQHDEDRFLSAQFAPTKEREKLMAIYAFAVEVSRIPELVSDVALGAIRQQWWRDAVGEIYSGEQVRMHPVVEAMSVVLDTEEASELRKSLEAVILNTGFFFEDRPISNLDQLCSIVQDTYGEALVIGSTCLVPDGLSNTETETVLQIETLGVLSRTLAAVTGHGLPQKTDRAAPFPARLARYAWEGGQDIITEVEQDFFELKSRFRELSSELMPMVAHACLVPRYLKIARHNMSDAPGAVVHVTELEKRFRLLGTVLTGYI